MKTIAIIVAGGSGSRFGGDVPKQFALLDGIPVLSHTLLAFDRALAGSDHRIVVSLARSLWHGWKEIAERGAVTVAHDTCEGGATRFHSVYNALCSVGDLADDDVVLVHDAARPLVSPSLIRAVALAAHASRHGIVPAVPLTDSVRQLDANGGSHVVDRAMLRAVQTPQGFNARMLKEAYDLAAAADVSRFTDDASVLEAMGGAIDLVEGETTNIKITYPADLPIAELIIKQRDNG